MSDYNTTNGSKTLAKNDGTNNTAIGAWAMSNNDRGDKNKASYNTAVGSDALKYIDGNKNTAVGQNANFLAKKVSYSTVLGYSADAEYDNSTSIGARARAGGKNQMQLGDSNTDVYMHQIHVTSDVRDKADVKDTKLGLDFLMHLRPVDYRWDLREDYEERVIKEVKEKNGDEEYIVEKEEVIQHPKDGSKKRTRFHHGFIAQELEALSEEFGGYQDHTINGGIDKNTLNYIELIAPMVKAIQEEQQLLINNLQEQISKMK
jgi:hypothetical protein